MRPKPGKRDLPPSNDPQRPPVGPGSGSRGKAPGLYETESDRRPCCKNCTCHKEIR